MTIYIHKPFCNRNHVVKHNGNSMVLRNQKLKLLNVFNRNEIAYSSELKFLGLFIMENLVWLVQIHSLCASLSEVYYMIKSLRDIMRTHMLWSIDFVYFHSWLKYGIIFWGRYGEIIQLFQLQKKVIRLITGIHKRESCRHIVRKFRILTLASMRSLKVLCLMKKYLGYLKQNFGIMVIIWEINLIKHMLL